MSDRIGELRSLMHEPNESSWSDLLTLLAKWPDEKELFDVVLPYCHDLLERWPEHLERPANIAMKHALNGRGSPEKATVWIALASLCSTVFWDHFHELSRLPVFDVTLPPPQPMFHAKTLAMHLFPSNEKMTMYLASHAMPNLHSLLVSQWHSHQQHMRLPSTPWIGSNLTHLWLQCPDDAITLVFGEANLSKVTHLSLMDAENSLQEEGLRCLLDKFSPGQLVSLNCNNAWLEFDSAEIIATHLALTNLRHFDLRYNATIETEGVELIQNSETLPSHIKEDMDTYYDDIFE